MVKVSFFLLDINYEMTEKGPEMRLWGLDGNGNRVLVIDRSFLPYLYVLPKEGVDAVTIVKRIEGLRKRQFPMISSLKELDLKYFGKPVRAIKVTCLDPEIIRKYAKEISKIEGVKTCLEDDIRYSSQYLIDVDMVPCGWHEIEVKEAEKMPGVQVDKVYVAEKSPVPTGEVKPPELRVMSFSITRYSKLGAPKPERDPVVIISVATNTGEKRNFIAKDSDDKDVLKSFIEFVLDFDPDVITGYASNRDTLPYLTERARKLGLTLTIDRCGSEPHTSLYGHVSITGRANVDFYDFAEDIAEVKVKTLENVAEFLGVKRREERIIIEETDIPKYWEDPEKRSLLVQYTDENAESILGISDVMLDFAIQFANLTRLPLDHVGTAAVGFRVENYLIYQAHKLKELVPKRIERPYFPYVGALVLTPKAGIHESVAVLDFKSMYPTLMINKNVSPDTYVAPGEVEPPSGVNIAPEVGHKFRKDPPGFYKQALSNLIRVRDEIRKELKKLHPKSPEYRVLDARQKAIKVVTNACYGYAGWIGARWYVKPVAEAVTAWGRETIQNTIKLAEEVGLNVIYGDTDSIFVRYEEEKIGKFSERVEEEVGLEAKPDRLYTRLLFTEAKKRYAGLVKEGWLDIVGLEVVRGDWAMIAKKVQEGVLNIILRERVEERAKKEAVEYVKKCVSELRERKIPFADLVIWKTLTKSLEEYEVKAPHVEAAKMLMEAGLELTLGDKIGFVITRGAGKLFERAKPYVMVSYEDLDLDYYVNDQILPAASRVLSVFGISEEDLRSKIL